MRAHELAPLKPSEAEPLFRQALKGYRKLQGPDGPLTLDLTLDLANLLNQSGRGADAEPPLRDALEPFRKQSGPDDFRMARILAPLGRSLIQQGKWNEAEPVLRECLAVRENLQPDEWTTFTTRSLLGRALLGQKKYAESEPLIVSGYEGMKAREAKIPPPGKPRLTEAAERVVKLYEAWGKKDKAAEWRARLAKPSDEAKPRP
jgi:eukaryotic-like serine/threonine-protein kinase